MTPNPPATPPAPAAPSADPRQAVNLPSIFLIIIGAIGALMALKGLLSSSAIPSGLFDQIEDANVKEMVAKLAATSASAGRFFNLLPLASSGLVIFGALKMRNLQSFGLAMAAAIVALIPCLGSPCCCLGIPFGIWALVVINKPDVKAAFT